MMEKHYCKSGGDQVVCKTIAGLKQKLTAALSAKNLGPYKAALAARKQEFCGGSKHHKTRCQAFKLISGKLPAFEQKLGFVSSAPAKDKPAERKPAEADKQGESHYQKAVDMMEKHYCKSGGDQVVCKIIGGLQQKLAAALSAKNFGPYKAALAAHKQEFCGGSKHHKTRCQAFKLISGKLAAFEASTAAKAASAASAQPSDSVASGDYKLVINQGVKQICSHGNNLFCKVSGGIVRQFATSPNPHNPSSPYQKYLNGLRKVHCKTAAVSESCAILERLQKMIPLSISNADTIAPTTEEVKTVMKSGSSSGAGLKQKAKLLALQMLKKQLELRKYQDMLKAGKHDDGWSPEGEINVRARVASAEVAAKKAMVSPRMIVRRH